MAVPTAPRAALSTSHLLSERGPPEPGKPTLHRPRPDAPAVWWGGACPSFSTPHSRNFHQPQRKSNLSPPLLLKRWAAQRNWTCWKQAPDTTPPDVLSWTQGSRESSEHVPILQMTPDRPHLVQPTPAWHFPSSTQRCNVRCWIPKAASN